MLNQKTYSLVSGIIFLLIAVLHLLRIAYGWEAMLAGWSVPLWPSWLALIIAGFLAYIGISLSQKQ